MEDWDGEIVISDVRNFKGENDFLEQAKTYLRGTDREKITLSKPTSMLILYIEDKEECWMSKHTAEKYETGFEGIEITVYSSEIEYED